MALLACATTPSEVVRAVWGKYAQGGQTAAEAQAFLFGEKTDEERADTMTRLAAFERGQLAVLKARGA